MRTGRVSEFDVCRRCGLDVLSARDQASLDLADEVGLEFVGAFCDCRRPVRVPWQRAREEVRMLGDLQPLGSVLAGVPLVSSPLA